MTLTITDIKEGEVPDIVTLWNSQLTVPNTIWRFTPPATESTISSIMARGKIAVLKSDKEPRGCGLWIGPTMLGIIAESAEHFYTILRAICEDQAGQTLFMVTNGANSNEFDWLDTIGITLSIEVVGYKPVKHEDMVGKTKEEILASRVPWVRHVRVSYDHMKEQIDKSGLSLSLSLSNGENK